MPNYSLFTFSCFDIGMACIIRTEFLEVKGLT